MRNISNNHNSKDNSNVHDTNENGNTHNRHIKQLMIMVGILVDLNPEECPNAEGMCWSSGRVPLSKDT